MILATILTFSIISLHLHIFKYPIFLLYDYG